MWHNAHLLYFSFCKWDIRAHSRARLSSFIGSWTELKLSPDLTRLFIVVDNRIQFLGIVGFRFQFPHWLLVGAALTSLRLPIFFCMWHPLSLTPRALHLWLNFLFSILISQFLYGSCDEVRPTKIIPVFRSSVPYNIILTLKLFCYEKPAQICLLFLDE